MMKLSALLTWIVVVAFAMVTTSAVEQCTIEVDKNSGCSLSDVTEIVKLLNEKFSGKRRYLNEQEEEEASPTGLRGAGAPAQEERKLQSTSCFTCYQTYGAGSIQCQPGQTCKSRRNLVSTAAADNFGKLIKDTLGTFGWDKCKPNMLRKMDCEDV